MRGRNHRIYLSSRRKAARFGSTSSVDCSIGARRFGPGPPSARPRRLTRRRACPGLGVSSTRPRFTRPQNYRARNSALPAPTTRSTRRLSAGRTARRGRALAAFLSTIVSRLSSIYLPGAPVFLDEPDRQRSSCPIGKASTTSMTPRSRALTAKWADWIRSTKPRRRKWALLDYAAMAGRPRRPAAVLPASSTSPADGARAVIDAGGRIMARISPPTPAGKASVFRSLAEHLRANRKPAVVCSPPIPGLPGSAFPISSRKRGIGGPRGAVSRRFRRYTRRGKSDLSCDLSLEHAFEGPVEAGGSLGIRRGRTCLATG